MDNPIACRTRSKQRRVVVSGLVMGRKRKRVVDDDELICLGDSLEGERGASGKIESGSGASSSSCDVLKRGFECLGEREDDPIEVIEIDNSDDEEGSRQCETKKFQVKEEERSDEGEECFVFADKVENFGGGECGDGPDNPVVLTFDSDGGTQSEDDGYDSLSSSTESEDGETSDEDFRVDDDGIECEYSSIEESDYSYDDGDSSYDDERGGCSKVVKARVRKVECETESSGVWRRKGERKDNKQVDEDEEDRWNGADYDYDYDSVTSSKSDICKEKTKKTEEKREARRVESVNADAEVFVDHWQSSGCSMSSEDEALEDKKKGDRGHQSVPLQKETRDSTVVKESQCVSLQRQTGDSTVVKESENHNNVNEGEEHNHDKGTGVGSVSSLPKRHEKIGDSAEVVMEENEKGREHVDGFNSNNSGKKVRVVYDETGDEDEVHKVKRMPSRTKNLGFKFFTESFGGKHDSVKDYSNGLEKKDDNVDQGQTQPFASRKTVPLNLNFVKKEPIEKSDSEKQINMLWNELDMMLEIGEIESQISLAARRKKEIGNSTWVKKSETNNNANANAIDCVNLDEYEGKEHHHDKGTSVRNVSSLPKSQEKIGDLAEVVIRKDKKGGEHKDGFINRNNREKKVRVVDDANGDKNELHEVLIMPSRTKDKGFKFFTECFWNKHDSVKDGSNELKEKDDDVHQDQTQPLACKDKIPLNWNFTKKEPVEKSESEKELDILWGEMDMLLRAEEIGSQIGTNEARQNEEGPASHCKHDTVLDEEIGVYCRLCGSVITEIKYIDPPFVDSERSGRRVSSGGVNISQFDGALFNEFGDDSGAVWSHNDGTVWDLIPDIKQSLYPHQQEGFEFIWTNLAGTTDLAKLKSVDPRSEGGCIISHAPGTGKTRLTMVFLQTYLQLFPKCLPVIIAPANILLTWEDELRKWNLGIPFHNMNNAELSGKEHAINEVDWSGNRQQNKDALRMVKLCSWYKDKSILLISYSLYEKLAGNSEVDGDKGKKNRKMKKEKKRARTREYIETAMGKVLRDYPGLLVLDEGHTPRNQRSCIWKVLSESRTQKRILLSGTPFQNNFLELYNILCLMKPSFPDSIPQELKKFCQSRLRQERQASKDVRWEPVPSGNPADKINQLKLLMNPFVHVHKGSILQKNLPGLRDCVLVLKPDSLQQETLESIECSQNGLNFEHKLALVSVHPSLFLNCSLSKKEESVIDKDQLEKLRLNPDIGVKTKFFMAFVKLCESVNEKVLVFSQFIDTLSLIKDQLKSSFNWSVGTEVLYMYGRLDQKQKQSLIHSFNDANSQAKVLLASIKACSEGINLIGASRVVLLDVVWNPSVERQAICRAYRLGQKRVVYTYHLLAQDTPECTKYCKQAEKDRLSELVFSNKNTENDKLKSSALEDSVLDLMVQHEKLKGMFGECLIQPTERDLETLGT